MPPNLDAAASSLLEKMRSKGISRTVLIQIIHYKWTTAIWSLCCTPIRKSSRGFARSTRRIERRGNGGGVEKYSSPRA